MSKRRRVANATSLLVLAVGWSIPAMATEGDVFAKGTKYNVATYDKTNPLGGGVNHPSKYKHSYLMPVDINIGSGDKDAGTILYAPEDGTVTKIYNNTNAWGYAIEWSNKSGSEKLFLAHLQEITKEGDVDAGDEIGKLGGTGGWSPHLHIESSKGWLELSGKKIHPPLNPPGNGDLYISKGPLSGGPGGPTDPDDPPASGSLPDFITNKVIIGNEGGSQEKYTWKVNETAYVHSWTDNIGTKDWEGSAKKIKVPFYLSKGKKKDSSSEWVRVGREEIKKDHLDVKDKPKREKIIFSIPQWAAAGYIYPGRNYNFVVCADRPKDQDNGDGDVKEIHKSNNCSTPAVFYVDYGPARNVDLISNNLTLTGGKSSLQAGESYGLQVELSNIGTEYPWNGCRTSYEIKGPGTGGVWQKVTDEGSTLAQLAPNTTKVEVIDESRGLKAPSVGGDYVFRACADYEQAIPETDEGNNCTAELPITVTVPPPPPVNPYFVITNPTSGDDWRSSEDDHDVEWEHYDFPVPGDVKIEYSLDDGATWLTIADNTTNDGKKHWHDMCDFHTVDTHHAYVRITSLDYPGVVAVSEEFSIDHAAECK
ncbi:peptidoglycan DD-metalloendopeptidase family protein [Candidatus Electronema sp. PJ]|uniref:peptidoglycan DD-metalloendopeptidase family protein n=1 Tax=Candidatus Electronema sp. PJ TaxID=3401572 RepID=UPI003AA7D896